MGFEDRRKYLPLVCRDGFKVSIEASEGNYCEPKNNEGPYSSVELGFPSAMEPLIMRYAEDPENPTGTVYGWVPSVVILEVIQKHGGWEEGELPPMVIHSAGD